MFVSPPGRFPRSLSGVFARIALISLCAALTLLPASAEEPPRRFAGQVAEFEAADAEQGFPVNGIVVIGSSSVRGWHGKIAEDLEPLTVIPRGFGGSTMEDALYYMDRIVLPYEPRAVMVYEGDNDVARGTEPETVLAQFREFVERIHEPLPQTRVYFLSIKPSIRRWEMWPAMAEANRLVAQYCATDERLTYIDVAAGMLDAAGEPKREIFREDDLHMTRDGYVIWRDIVRPVLMEREADAEKSVRFPE